MGFSFAFCTRNKVGFFSFTNGCHGLSFIAAVIPNSYKCLLCLTQVNLSKVFHMVISSVVLVLCFLVYLGTSIIFGLFHRLCFLVSCNLLFECCMCCKFRHFCLRGFFLSRWELAQKVMKCFHLESKANVIYIKNVSYNGCNCIHPWYIGIYIQ